MRPQAVACGSAGFALVRTSGPGAAPCEAERLMALHCRSGVTIVIGLQAFLLRCSKWVRFAPQVPGLHVFVRHVIQCAHWDSKPANRSWRCEQSILSSHGPESSEFLAEISLYSVMKIHDIDFNASKSMHKVPFDVKTRLGGGNFS